MVRGGCKQPLVRLPCSLHGAGWPSASTRPNLPFFSATSSEVADTLQLRISALAQFTHQPALQRTPGQGLDGTHPLQMLIHVQHINPT